MKAWLLVLLPLCILAGCAHLPSKDSAGPDAGLVIVPIQTNNQSDVEWVVSPYFWFSDYGVVPKATDLASTKENILGESVLGAGKRLIRVVKQAAPLIAIRALPAYSPSGAVKVQSFKVFEKLPYVPGKVVVADFKFVFTQTKHGGSYYNYHWEFVRLSDSEKESILADYRSDKANAAWFE